MKKQHFLFSIFVLSFFVTFSQNLVAKNSKKVDIALSEALKNKESSSRINIQVLLDPQKDFSSALTYLENNCALKVTLSIPEDHYFEALITVALMDTLLNHISVQRVDLLDDEDISDAVHDRAAAVRSNWLNSSVTGLSFDGTGITVGVRESKSIDNNDIDFSLRQKNGFETGEVGSHKTGVASHLASAGNSNPRQSGILPGADFYDLGIGGLNFNTLFSTYDIRYFNRSSGYTIGSAYYTIDSKNRDQNVYNNPEIIFVYSAGNENGSSGNYNYGPYKNLSGTEYCTVTSDEKSAKNNIVCQSVDQYDKGYGSGSRGPVYDGRMKPDLTADGEFGTSHAAPKITGVLGLLGQAYFHHYQTHPHSALLKAILFNSTDDVGRSGPDYRYGFGKMNAKRAYETLAQQRFYTDTMTMGKQDTFKLKIPTTGAVEFKATLAWCDPPADVTTTPDTALVNNLDLYVLIGDTVIYPWVLSTFPDEDSLRQDAKRSIDNLNNAEQVSFMIPSEYYGADVSIIVAGKKLSSSYPQQNYFVAYEVVQKHLTVTTPLGGEKWRPGDEQIIRWDAYGTSSDFRVQIKEASSSTWITLSDVPNANRYYPWNIDQIADFYFKEYQVRVFTITDSLADSSQTFVLAPVPENLKYEYTCDSVHYLSWTPFDSAGISYNLYYLGGKYMVKNPQSFIDSIGYSSTTYPFYAVSATSNGIEGRRSQAVFAPGDSTYCLITKTEDKPSIKVKIVPNPAASIVAVTGLDLGESYSMALYNTIGQIVMIRDNYKNNNQIDISRLKAGNYHLLLLNNSGNERIYLQLSKVESIY